MQRRTYLRLLAAGTTGTAATGVSDSDYLVGAAQAQTNDDGWEQTATLPIERNREDTNFGQDIAYDGEKVLIGEYYAGHVYTRADNWAWQQEAELVPDDLPAPENSRYGAAVAWLDDAALVADGPETLYVFEEQSDEWRQTAELTASDAIGTNREHSVATAGEQAVLGVAGALNADDVPTGAAYVYGREDDNWTLETALRPDDLGESDAFGLSAAGADGQLLIGTTRQESPDGEFAGAVYVFEEQDGEWRQSTKLVADDAGAQDIFGFDISLDNDMAVIGAPYANTPDSGRSGAAYLFERGGGDWAQIAKLVADESEEGDYFGHTVALDEDNLIVGSPHQPGPNGERAGAAYTFESKGQWEQIGKLLPDDINQRDRFGTAVALDGREAIIGAPAKELPDADPRTEAGGKAYLFNSGSTSATATSTGTDGTTTTDTATPAPTQKDDDLLIPWGIAAALGGLGVTGYLLKRRRDGDD